MAKDSARLNVLCGRAGSTVQHCNFHRHWLADGPRITPHTAESHDRLAGLPADAIIVGIAVVIVVADDGATPVCG